MDFIESQDPPVWHGTQILEADCDRVHNGRPATIRKVGGRWLHVHAGWWILSCEDGRERVVDADTLEREFQAKAEVPK